MAKLADPVTRLLVEVQYLENLAQSLQQRISYVEAAVAELQVAMSTVRNLLMRPLELRSLSQSVAAHTYGQRWRTLRSLSWGLAPT
ncbi:hypothetical protein MUP00_11500 [Candidatus Bathyarchaeota archaeon]|nr:hypothetical protein [Candidatus Bathyarchaeota archaeon]